MSEKSNSERHKGYKLTIYLSEKERNTLEHIQETLQSRAATGVHISQRIAILEALDCLSKRMAKYEQDKERPR